MATAVLGKHANFLPPQAQSEIQVSNIKAKQLTLTKEQVSLGDLVLVNPSHPWVSTYPLSLITWNHPSGSVLLQYTASMRLQALIEKLGIKKSVIPNSGYRSRSEQEEILAETIRSEGEEYAAKYVAQPGFSEHHTGLAVDLSFRKNTLSSKLSSLTGHDARHRFTSMCKEYGFVERYGQGKEHITGIAHEPWHFRYVGVPHAQIMGENDSSLEEYHFFLRHFSKDRPLRYHIGNLHYEIFYAPLPKDGALEIDLSEYNSYEWSGDNECGFFLTTTVNR